MPLGEREREGERERGREGEEVGQGPYSDVCAELLVEGDWRMAKLVDKGVLTLMFEPSTRGLKAS